MIKGRKRVLVSYFDQINFPNSSRTYTESLYHFFIGESYYHDELRPEFELTNYLDLLSAPYFISKKMYDASFDYPESAVEYFFKLFPTQNEFENALAEYFDFAKEEMCVDNLFNHRRDSLLDAITEKVRHLESVKSFLSEPMLRIDKGYSSVALKMTDKLLSLVSQTQNQIKLLPADVHEYGYYVVHKDVSWYQNPLAYFTQVFSAHDVEKFKNDYRFFLQEYDIEDDISTFIHKVFRREYGKTRKLIIENLSNRRSLKSKQEYVDHIKTCITILHYIALNHPLKNLYPTPERPFCSLIKALKTQFGRIDWYVPFNFDVVYEEPRIYSQQFLKELLRFRFIDRERRQLTLFSHPLTTTELKLFLRGKFGRLKQIDFNWPKGAVYHLLQKLQHEGADFEFKKNQYEHKIFINKNPFNADSFYTQKSKGKQSPLFEQIDSLFR